jgi:hypothetical protein
MAGRWSNLTPIIALVAFSFLGCASQKPGAKEATSDPWTKASTIGTKITVKLPRSTDGNATPQGLTEPVINGEVYAAVIETGYVNQSAITARRLPTTVEDRYSEIRQIEFRLEAEEVSRQKPPESQGTPTAVEELPTICAKQPVQLDRDTVSAVPIDFSTALAVAAGDNPQVAFARQRINEAYAQAMAANAMWIPSLRAGMSWNKHEGTIQDVEGNLIETSRGSAYAGFGANAVGAGSPAVPGLIVDMRLRDAIFRPRIAEQLLGASRQASRATTNDILFNTASAYNDLLEAMAYEAVTRTTLNNSIQLTEVTADFAHVGQGLISDADRARAEQSVAEIEVRRAVEGVQIASVRLARIISEDPTLQLVPQ